jgi:hypothetical protein
MSHICITTEGKVHINKTLKNLKIEDMYAIIKCINTGEAMNRIKSHEFLDENDYLYSELPFNKAWIDICKIVQEVDVELAPKPKKPKKAESKIPVKKSIPTEDILNLDMAESKNSESSVKIIEPVKKELTKELLINTVHTYLDSVNLKEMFAKDIIEILDKTFKL